MTFVLGGTEYTLTAEHYVRKVRKVYLSFCLSSVFSGWSFQLALRLLNEHSLTLHSGSIHFRCFYVLSYVLCVLYLCLNNNISLSCIFMVEMTNEFEL